MRRNYKTSSINSKCHKVLPASQRTTNHTPTPLFCLSCYFGTLVFSSLNVVPLHFAITISSLATQEHYWIIHLKQFKRLLCRSLLLQVLEANWKTNRRRIGNCKVVQMTMMTPGVDRTAGKSRRVVWDDEGSQGGSTPLGQARSPSPQKLILHHHLLWQHLQLPKKCKNMGAIDTTR